VFGGVALMVASMRVSSTTVIATLSACSGSTCPCRSSAKPVSRSAPLVADPSAHST